MKLYLVIYYKLTEILNIEGRIRAEYYTKFDEILPDNFKMEGRSRQPPKKYD